MDLETLLLPDKRRLELRNTESSDLVMILASDAIVESRDLVIVDVESNTWSVAEWGLTIKLIPMAEGGSLTDISDRDGNRIICLLI